MNSGDKKPYNLTSPVSVVSTVARTSLGVIYKTRFNAEFHSEEDRFWNGVEGEWFAIRQVKWFLRKVRKYDNDAEHRELLMVDRFARVTMFVNWNPNKNHSTSLTVTKKTTTLLKKKKSSSVKTITLHRGQLLV